MPLRGFLRLLVLVGYLLRFYAANYVDYIGLLSLSYRIADIVMLYIKGYIVIQVHKGTLKVRSPAQYVNDPYSRVLNPTYPKREQK